MCDECIKKKRLRFSIQEALAGFVGAVFLIMLFALTLLKNATFNKHAALIFTGSLLIGMVVSIIVYIVSMKKEMPFIAAMLLQKTKKQAGVGNALVLVPMDQRLYVSKKTGYPDLEIFKSKTGLKTEVGLTIFTQFIITGLGDLLNINVSQNTQAPAPLGTTAPVKTPDSLLEDSVNQLVTLYKKSPGGYLRANATELRQIGIHLNGAGGMALMLQAHERFAARNPNTARNLEMMWDGIGEWRG